MVSHINPALLEEWKKEGELVAIFGCPRCFKKIPFYKSGIDLIDSIYIALARDREYCWRCEKIMQNKKNRNNLENKKKEGQRIIQLIKKYEPDKVNVEPISELCINQ